MKKRIIALMLTALMGVSVLVGCGSSGTASASTEASGGYKTTYGDKQFDNVTITVELFDRSNAPEGSTITDNRWTKYVNEQMNKVGINVEFVTVPRSDEVTKMQTMVGAQTAPDITITYTDWVSGSDEVDNPLNANAPTLNPTAL